jgi:hypothetical protein
VRAGVLRATLALCLCASLRASAEEDVNQRLQRLESQMRDLQKDHDALEERVQALTSMLSGRLSGYLDFGFFRVQGDGSGLMTDINHTYYPEYKDVPDSWVFLGDPLSTAVNSRGEPATTGQSRAVVYDPINNGGVASFIVNAMNVFLFAGIGRNVTLNASIDFVPRSRNVSQAAPNDPSKIGTALGDFIDVKLAYVEYTVPSDRFDLRLSVGKLDSVLGIEYRTQESPDRIGVIPSLICRYTCGRPLGVKLRGRFFNDAFTVALAVTNGSNFIEGFPFYDEIDTNDFKTISGRISIRRPVGAGLEIGASGAFGAQDFQTDNNVWQWHAGADLHFEIRDFDLRAEYVRGAAEGKDLPGPPSVPCGVAPCLHYQGAYGQIAYRVLNWLIPYARVDWRDALHRSGESFLYISELMRVTGGVRLELGTNVIVKAEYTYNRELGRIPQFPDDIFTSSMVVKY